LLRKLKRIINMSKKPEMFEEWCPRFNNTEDNVDLYSWDPEVNNM